MIVPDTRHSLLLRLTDASDVSAWDEFVAIMSRWFIGWLGAGDCSMQMLRKSFRK